MKTTEEELITACKNNDSEAFKQIYDMYAPKMMGVCMRYMHNRVEAEDILQDSFIKVYLNIKRYRGEGSFEGWIRRIVINVAINKLRNDAKKELKLIDDEELKNIKDNEYSDMNNDVEYKYSAQQMLNAIQKLSNMNRAVFNLAEIEGYSYKEIAEQLNTSESTARSTLSRAKSILKAILEKQSK
ncbi:MAG: RNA polymerase sigma factor [Bacteroidales bacterium]|nr:RNA polymerase sigma factor [Bacteroidales bacterium]